MNTMPHRTYLHYSFCKALLLVLAFFLSSASFLSAVPPIDLLEKREVIIDQKDRKAAKAAKKRWKKEKRKKIRNDKAARKASRNRGLFTTLIIIGMVLGMLAYAVLLGFAFGFGTDFGFVALVSMGALLVLLLGLWGIAKVNQKDGRFLRIIELILIAVATLGLFSSFTLFFFSGFGTPLSILLLGILAAAVLFFGTWLFIRSLRR
jgi:cation transport ATPase